MAKRRITYDGLVDHSEAALKEGVGYAWELIGEVVVLSDSVILTPEQKRELLVRASELEHKASRASHLL